MSEDRIAEDPRPLLVFRGCVLVEAVRGEGGRVRCLFYAPEGGREPGRPVLREPVHWFRCALDAEEPLLRLVFQGGFYQYSEFGPRGMELGTAVIVGRLAGHERSGFPEAFVLEGVDVQSWRA